MAEILQMRARIAKKAHSSGVSMVPNTSPARNWSPYPFFGPVMTVLPSSLARVILSYITLHLFACFLAFSGFPRLSDIRLGGDSFCFLFLFPGFAAASVMFLFSFLGPPVWVWGCRRIPALTLALHCFARLHLFSFAYRLHLHHFPHPLLLSFACRFVLHGFHHCFVLSPAFALGR